MNLDGRRESSNVEDRRVKQVTATCFSVPPAVYTDCGRFPYCR